MKLINKYVVSDKTLEQVHYLLAGGEKEPLPSGENEPSGGEKMEGVVPAGRDSGGEEWDGPKHRPSSAEDDLERRVDWDPAQQRLVTVSGRSGAWMDALELTFANTGIDPEIRVESFGGMGGSTFSVSVPEGHTFVAFFGGCNPDYLHHVGLWSVPPDGFQEPCVERMGSNRSSASGNLFSAAGQVRFQDAKAAQDLFLAGENPDALDYLSEKLTGHAMRCEVFPPADKNAVWSGKFSEEGREMGECNTRYSFTFSASAGDEDKGEVTGSMTDVDGSAEVQGKYNAACGRATWTETMPGLTSLAFVEAKFGANGLVVLSGFYVADTGLDGDLEISQEESMPGPKDTQVDVS